MLINRLGKTLLTISVGFQLLAANAAQINQIQAVVKQVVGEAAFMDANGRTNVLKNGMTLGEGDTLITGTNSSVAFVVAKHRAVFRLMSNGRLTFNRMWLVADVADLPTEMEWDLKAGALIGSVGREVRGSDKFSIKTAKGVIGVRGTTDFSVTAAMDVHCRNGNIVAMFIIGSARPPVTIQIGQSLRRPEVPGRIPTIYPTPPEIAFTSDKEIAELKKLAGYQ